MKAQVSIEFIIIIIIFLSALTVISVVSIVRTRDIQVSNLNRESFSLLDTIASSLNTVYLEGNGFMTNITIPDNILGSPYTLNITLNFLTMDIQNSSFSRTLLTDNITGILIPGTVMLENIFGEVIIS